TTVPLTDIAPDDEFNISSAKNNRALILERFGKTIANAFLHTPHPLRRSVLAELEAEFPEVVDRTAHAPLRSHTDVSIASSLHHYYAYLTGRSVPAPISCGFINVGLREQQTKLTRLLSARIHDVFCLNDYHDGDVPAEEQSRIIDTFLTEYFPTASQFETGTVRNGRVER
ncbi:stealth conserved region 3 domain-containing protein, partial [Yinghuangia aomiensis]|uniref:stealth conserved region 3 domain-containing protein n=1 Tax=Yinghuangia aomiensis TaxID=676205 RepID=UPI0031E74D1D